MPNPGMFNRCPLRSREQSSSGELVIVMKYKKEKGLLCKPKRIFLNNIRLLYRMCASNAAGKSIRSNTIKNARSM
jgi:hypothetical protein